MVVAAGVTQRKGRYLWILIMAPRRMGRSGALRKSLGLKADSASLKLMLMIS
jgi:hypothetical protein